MAKKQLPTERELKDGLQELWQEQLKVLDQAGKVVREASNQVAKYSKRELKPRLDAVIGGAAHAADTGWNYTKATAAVAKDKITRDVLPAVATAMGSALAVFDLAKDPRVRNAMAQSRDRLKNLGKTKTVVIVPPAKKKRGFGRALLIGAGIATLAGAAWAAWQALRADDDLWFEEVQSED